MTLAILLSSDRFNYILYGWIALAVIIFFVLLRIPAPYGRHATKKWGPAISNRLGWFIMEFTVLITLVIVIYPDVASLSTVSWIILSLFSFHYMNRSFIFPFRLHTKGKKMPVIVAFSGIIFNIMNGFSLGYFMTQIADYQLTWLMDFRFITGIILFFLGMAINWHTDNILIHLRKPGQTHYSIPERGLFTYISCPNLFGELIEWLGFAILCWNLPALTFFIWTAANLIPRALSHHRWYKTTFTNYPASRKAVLPFFV
jgi:hypothetical protein